MKIDVSHLIKDHLLTLRNARTGKISKSDILLFYALPLVLAFIVYWTGFSVSKDVYNVSVTFFGIFIALLLNVQVAVFGIFQRKWKSKKDERLDEIQDESLELRRQLMQEINVNISYLVLISCFALVLFLVIFAMELTSGLSVALSVLIYAHFILTLLMVVKRSHALFKKEYSEE